MQVPLEWKLSVSGDNEVKTVMSDLNSAFQRGQISGSDYADSMSKIGRESNKVNNISRYQNQIFLSMHPNINKLSRGFSTLASVARTAMTIFTTINTLMIAQNTTNSETARILADIAANNREIARTDNPERRQQLIEDNNVLNAQLKEQKGRDQQQFWEGIAIGIGAVVLVVDKIIKHIPTLLRFIPSLSALANPFIAIGVAMSLIGGYIADFLVGLLGISEWRENNGKLLTEFFTVSIPLALGQAGAFISNFFLNDLPNWASQGWKAVSDIFVFTWNTLMTIIEKGINGALKGFSDFVNTIINGINSIISGINRAFKSNIPKIQPFVVQNISLPKINSDVGSPAGSPNGGQIGPSNTYITVQGSVISEREFKSLMDNTFKQWMKDRGFTGYQ